MQFSLKKLCLREDWTLPSFKSMFPAAISQSSSDTLSVDASMTLGGLPPLHPLNEMTKQHDVKTENVNTNADVVVANANEIVTAFESLDAEAADVAVSSGSLALEFQCRYRKGKCSQPRTLKKNGSMHSYCEHHRQLSIRNQRVFDQKKRRQQELEIDEPETIPKRPRRRSTMSLSSSDEVKESSLEKRPKHRRQTV